MRHHALAVAVMAFGLVACKPAVNVPSVAQSHDAYASLVGYLGGVNRSMQDSVAQQGYQTLYDALKGTCGEGFDEAMSGMATELQSRGFDAATATLTVEAFRRFQRDGVCG